MVRVIKFMNKDLNLGRLQEELEAVGFSESGLLLAGFENTGKEQYKPNAARKVIATQTRGDDVTEDSADPGELRFTLERELSVPQDDALNRVLVAHDATVLSKSQMNQDTDSIQVETLISNYENWATLTPSQLAENTKILTRMVARLHDRSNDL